MRTLRLFALLDHLRGRPNPVSAERLAVDLNVSIRTIYRDMATLQAMGAPVRGEAGIGYQMERGYFLPPLQFDADELEAIMLGTRLIAARGDSELSDAARRVSAKVSAAMDGEAGEVYTRLPLRAIARQTEEGMKAGAHLGFLRSAVRERAQLHILYLDLKEAKSQRIARPLGLTVFDHVWLLTIWCETKNDFRNLRVDRIEAVERTGTRFRPEVGKRFEDYLKTLP
ncbi:helix-turn-helix transcriptional regulator [Pseudaminobacter soli (ex Li et al. 2025)]|uniref:DNA-binding transcriptional regulator n=1 Tax=Pseudaminobacter soli (ex Li et al. 2025) TaxID=1295366 RepID=A0A2P7RNG9_9HYPH|nr:YafY family protein [Mesorhizobium soli]PSJ51725.1 DNA-binding transcriptional regulator [Mesorhizobium soli]